MGKILSALASGLYAGAAGLYSLRRLVISIIGCKALARARATVQQHIAAMPARDGKRHHVLPQLAGALDTLAWRLLRQGCFVNGHLAASSGAAAANHALEAGVLHVHRRVTNAHAACGQTRKVQTKLHAESADQGH